MTAPNADNSRSVTRYLGQNYQFCPFYSRTRDPTTGDIRDPRNQGYYPFAAMWINKSVSPLNNKANNLWALVQIANNLATWILLSGGSSGPMLALLGGANTTNFPAAGVVPNALGQITIATDANIAIDGGTLNQVTFSLVGGHAIDTIVTDTGGAGLHGATINLNSAAPYATNTGPNAVAVTNSSATQGNIALQLAGSNAGSSTANKFGIAEFDANQFDVTSGFVQLKGSTGPALTKLALQTGTSHIVPDATGQMTLNGAVVAAGTNPVRTDGTGANTGAIEVQISQALAASDATKIGLANFNSLNFAVDANGFVTAVSGIQPGVSNLGLNYTAGTFTVTSASGAALSSTNPAYVTLQSATSAQLITVAVTANQTFTDGSGNTDTWRGGVSPTDAAGGVSSDWNQDMPFFLYAVLGTSNDIAFMFSRNPAATGSPAAGSISKTGAILNTGQGDFFSLLGGTIANYASRPCLCIGSFRMRNVVTGGNIRYTVQTLTLNDGIGIFQEGTTFTLPTGVNGSKATKYFQATAGTEPTFTSNAVVYKINRSGIVWFSANFQTVNNVPAGAQVSSVTCPYACNSSAGHAAITGSYTINATSAVHTLSGTLNSSANNITNIATSGATSFFNNATYAANDSMCIRDIYPAF